MPTLDKFEIKDSISVTRALIENCFVLIIHCSITCINPENNTTKGIKNKKFPISFKLNKLVILLLKKNIIINDKILSIIVIKIESLIKPFATRLSFGNTIAMG